MDDWMEQGEGIVTCFLISGMFLELRKICGILELKFITKVISRFQNCAFLNRSISMNS
jgi:hypothetical protein